MVLVLVSAMAACGQAIDSTQTFPEPSATSACPACITHLPTSTPTFQPKAPAWQKPAGDENILPAPLYFVSAKTDEEGQVCYEPHIVRIERDGHTRTMITSCRIDGGINGFDVSPIDASVVYIAQGSMWIIDGKSEEPRLLLVGSPNPEYPNPRRYDMRNLAWSPDGAKIAYEDGGIRILNVATGEILNVTGELCEAKNGDDLFGIDPCQYRGAYRILQWSPDSKALMVLKDDEDSRSLVIYTFQNDKKILLSYEVDYHQSWMSDGTAAWGKDGSTFLIDQSYRETQDQDADWKYDLRRIGRDGSNSQIIWPSQEHRDFLSLNGISESAGAHDLLETADGRILFSLEGYLVELNPVGTTFQAMIVIAKGAGLNMWGWHWYKNGKYLAGRSESGRMINDGQNYIGMEYIGVMEVETGKIYLLAEEDSFSVPHYQEVYETNHLVWGLP